MAYAPVEIPNLSLEPQPNEAASFNPVLQTLEAALSGEAPNVPLAMTPEERAGRRAILENPGPPSEKLIAALAARLRSRRAANEI